MSPDLSDPAPRVAFGTPGHRRSSVGRRLIEVPVGFKWLVPGLSDGSVGFGSEESAGESFLGKYGSVWTTDKDGIILCLLAAQILAVTGSSPSQHHRRLAESFADPAYAGVDAPATRDQKAVLAKLSPQQVTATMLAGAAITAKLTTAPGNGAAIGGLKVTTENAWFAARPSGTDVHKIYAKSFRGSEHLVEVQAATRAFVSKLSMPDGVGLPVNRAVRRSTYCRSAGVGWNR